MAIMEASGDRSLKAKAAAWRDQLRSGATGPLVIAQQVVDLVAEWENWRTEAGGVDANAWLRATFGQSVAWFERRARAVRDIDESIRRSWNHEVAVWVHQHVTTAELRKQVVFAFAKAAR